MLVKHMANGLYHDVPARQSIHVFYKSPTEREQLCSSQLYHLKTKKEHKTRTVHSNILYDRTKGEDNPNRHYSDNKIKTTKYTLLSFLPKNLFEQFHRFANVYFVFIALLNFVPVCNAFQPQLALAPVVFILSVTAIKDLWEDYRRHRSDKEINHMDCLVYSRYSIYPMDYINCVQ
uniref:P-type ATPase N-terminal domain-containing protein n=1 Tax=Hucho hucho TaxID=62062 RepID=A0A4W5KUL6_9TELE